MPNKVQIPKEFELFGQKLRVEIDPTISERQHYGESNFSRGFVRLEPFGGRGQPTRTYIEQTFWHEILHCVFRSLGLTKLDNNEALIEQVSMGIHQVLASMRGSL